MSSTWFKQRLPTDSFAQFIGASYNEVMRVLAYYSIVSSGLVLYVAWNAGIKDTFHSFLWLIAALMGGIVLLMILDYLFIWPSIVSYTNRQTAKHPNPMLDEIKALRSEVRQYREELQRSQPRTIPEQAQCEQCRAICLRSLVAIGSPRHP